MILAMCQATCYVMHMGAVDRTFSMKLSTRRAPIDLHYRVERPDPGYRYLRHHAIDASPYRLLGIRGDGLPRWARLPGSSS